MSLRLPRRRPWRVAIYLVCFILVFIAVDLVLVEMRRTIHPGYQTTRIMPSQPNAPVDYLHAIEDRFGEGVTAENNAAPLLLEAFGRSALPFNQPPDGITHRLDMAHVPEHGDYLVSYEAFAKARHDESPAPDLLDPSERISLPLKVSPTLEAWLKANEKPLALVTQASTRTRFFIPFDGGNRPESMISVLLPHVLPMRQAVGALITRALVRLEGGDVDGCRADLLSANRVARLLGQAPTLVERMAANAMEGAACRAERAAARSAKLSSAQARAMADDLASLPELRPVSEALDVSERFMFLDTMQTAARLGPAGAARFLSAITDGVEPRPAIIARTVLFHLVPMPYEQSMRLGNQWYDGAVVALNQPTYARMDSALRLWESGADRLSSTNSLAALISGEWPLRIFVPALVRAEHRHQQARMEGRLTRIALALAAYKADHNSYPATLDELAPAYLSHVPDDLFSDRLPIYSRISDRYVLYSVGPNRIDEGGRDTGGADDVVASEPATP